MKVSFCISSTWIKTNTNQLVQRSQVSPLIMKKNSEPISSNSHLTTNEKWKLWVGWHHGSSYWLLCLCVLCFMFCTVSNTIQCSQVSPISISKNENYELCISAGFFVTTGKKVPVVCLAKKKRYSRLCISTGFFVTTGKKISSSRLSGEKR